MASLEENAPAQPSNERPKLQLSKKGAGGAGGAGGAAPAPRKGGNPFGAARTREEILAARGVDAKAEDRKLDERVKRAPRLTKEQREELKTLKAELALKKAEGEGAATDAEKAANADVVSAKQKEIDDLAAKFHAANLAEETKAPKERPKFERPSERRKRLEAERGEGPPPDAERDAAFESFNRRSGGGGSYGGSYGGGGGGYRQNDDAFASFGGGGRRREAAPGCKLYVGGVSYGATKEDIAGLFGQYGRVTDSHVPIDRETGQPRGFAFVTFSSAQEAEAAVQALDGFEMDGRPLRVNVSDPANRGGGGGGSYSRQGGDDAFASFGGGRRDRDGGGYGGGSYGGGGGGGYRQNDDAFASFGGGGRRREAAPGCKLYVGNIPFSMNQGDLQQMFGPYGQVTDSHVPIDRETGQPRGFAFVTFAGPDQAQAAVQAMDGFECDGRQLRVNVSDPNQGGGGGRY